MEQAITTLMEFGASRVIKKKNSKQGSIEIVYIWQSNQNAHLL